MSPRSTHENHRLTHFNKNKGNNSFKPVKGIQRKYEKSKKNNELIYNTKAHLKTHESKLISIKQAWIPKCLFNVLDTLKDLNRTKQL